jgi:hypothetical protein
MLRISISPAGLLRAMAIGGPGEIRTHDLFHAMEARSQLRHRPTVEVLSFTISCWFRYHGRNGTRTSLEPAV